MLSDDEPATPAVLLSGNVASEAEILGTHQAALRRARQYCLELRRQAVAPTPRGRIHRELRAACGQLESTCRGMGHKRGDYRWFKLGGVYGAAQQKIDEMFIGQRWPGFGELAGLFELGLRRADDLTHRATGKPGTLILPPYMMQ